MRSVTSDRARRWSRLAAFGVLAVGAAPAVAVSGNVHVVAQGETLMSISRRYHKPLKQIADANHIPLYTHLKIGERIVIPGRMVAAAAPAPKRVPRSAVAAPKVPPQLAPAPPPAAPKVAEAGPASANRVAGGGQGPGMTMRSPILRWVRSGM
jgi:LysM repeat protein